MRWYYLIILLICVPLDVQVIMVIMSERKVDRYLRHAIEDMYKNEEQEIRCPCRKCKLMTLHHPYSGVVRDHLLMRGFMDGAPWMNDEDDVEVHAAPMAVHDDEGHHDMTIVENNNEGERRRRADDHT